MNKDDIIKKNSEVGFSDISLFRPTDAQIMAKARFHKALETKTFLVDKHNLRLADVEAMTGSRSIQKWCENSPMFFLWLLDNDFEVVRLTAFVELALNEVVGILKSPYIEKTLTAKDKLKAAEIIFNLSGKFKPAPVFLDKELAAMDENIVDIELAKARRKITDS